MGRAKKDKKNKEGYGYKYLLFFLFSRHKQNLKVREHNILGPYVDGLSTLVVTSFEVKKMSM